jgi:DNA-binding YbaB/EbfC family protein
MFDIKKMMDQAKKVQDQMMDIQEELANAEIVGVSKCGGVKITCTGKFECKSVDIVSDALLSDKAKLQTAIAEAFTNVAEQVMKRTQDKMASLTKGLNIPGLKLPGM